MATGTRNKSWSPAHRVFGAKAPRPLQRELLQRGEQARAACGEMSESAKVLLEQNGALMRATRAIQRDLAPRKKKSNNSADETLTRLRQFQTELTASFREALAGFIETEFQACETFVCLALRDGGDDAKARFTRNARKAHDAIVHFLPRAGFRKDQLADAERRLGSLREELRKLSETVD